MFDVANDRRHIRDGLLIAFAALWALNLADAYFNGNESVSVELSGQSTGLAVAF